MNDNNDNERITATMEPDEIIEKTLDPEGRLYVGREHSGEAVRVAIEYQNEDEEQ